MFYVNYELIFIQLLNCQQLHAISTWALSLPSASHFATSSVGAIFSVVFPQVK